MILTRNEQQRIIGQFSPEFLERLRNAFLVEQIEAAVADGKIPESAVAPHRMPAIGGGAAGFYITNAEAVSMLTDYFVGVNAGTAAVIQIYAADVGVPADADAANSNTLLATLTCATTAQASIADDTPGALATFDTITGDSSADATDTAAFFRISTQAGGTVVAQGTVGTSDADLILNTVAITSGSTVDITAASILLPEGP
jgi:hypothetical protein